MDGLARPSPVQMDEAERFKHKIPAPDLEAWNDQMYRIRVFDKLIYDTDPNGTTYSLAMTGKFIASISLGHFGCLRTCGVQKTLYTVIASCWNG